MDHRRLPAPPRYATAPRIPLVPAVQRRTGIPVSALRGLAEADAFLGLGLRRREALWAVRGLADASLPLFEAGEAGYPSRPEGSEPDVALAAMPEGRKVVEDYSTVGLSLRQHPVAFLREELKGKGMNPCGDLKRTRSGRRVAVAGLVLVRQKPGSAKGVMFITIEDETGIGNLIVWPKVFEQGRCLVLSEGMLGCRGRVQSENGVTHLIVEELADLTPLLGSVGRRGAAFPLPHGRGDEARRGGSPDSRERDGLEMRKVRDIYIPDLRLGSGIKVPTRDFR